MKKRNLWLLISLLLIVGLLAVACGGDEEAAEAPEPEAAEEPAEDAAEEPAEEPSEEPEPVEPMEDSSITIIIPEDPAGFNAYAADTGYSQMLMELVMMGLADLDAEGNIFPELAVELPTIENGGVEFDEEAWTMDVTWKLRD
ncbi:MAG: hypothetical protein JSW55_06920, partial [Chloroflexota bacterium]